MFVSIAVRAVSMWATAPRVRPRGPCSPGSSFRLIRALIRLLCSTLPPPEFLCPGVFTRLYAVLPGLLSCHVDPEPAQLSSLEEPSTAAG